MCAQLFGDGEGGIDVAAGATGEDHHAVSHGPPPVPPSKWFYRDPKGVIQGVCYLFFNIWCMLNVNVNRIRTVESISHAVMV